MFIIYSSNVLGLENNCLYPHAYEIKDEDSLKSAVKHDYVCAEYKNSYRLNENFIGSNCLPVDCDNDHSENPSEWITREKVEKAFPGVSFAIHYSRHNNLPKGNKSARPRAHYLFPIKRITNAEEYASLKKRLNEIFPYFDKKALDAARFFYGTKDPKVEIVKGKITLNEFIDSLDDEFDYDMKAGVYGGYQIKEGSRNSEMSHIAGKLIKRYGNTEKSRHAFIEMAKKCIPPLSQTELRTIWNSAKKFGKKIEKQEGYVNPEEYNKTKNDIDDKIIWDKPIPLENEETPEFPIEVLPKRLQKYAYYVSKSTQTPIDMASVGIIATISACMRNLYRVEGKKDWLEPTNIYTVIIAEPSERKSAVISHITKPVDDYIKKYNNAHKIDFEMSRIMKQKLENRKNALLNSSKKKDEGETANDFNDKIREIVEEIINFEEKKPLKIYIDDTTTEKLTELLSENNNTMSIISSEGGIFDVISGIYSSKVNIDVFLKSYSGENICVERIMRNSIKVEKACLTILLSVQPVVISELMGNKKFRHRGLTARFLYTMPKSIMGSRKLNTDVISEDAYKDYKEIVENILMEDGKDKIITIDESAKEVLSDYYDWVEKMLVGEFSMYADWLGKLVGNTLRLAGILARSSVIKKYEILCDDNIVIDKKIMTNAIKLGKYFLLHAINTYSDMGVKSDYKALLVVIDKIKEKGLNDINRRDLMRMCSWIRNADRAQSILDMLEDYGYVSISSVTSADKSRGGRPKNARYLVNPNIYHHLS